MSDKRKLFEEVSAPAPSAAEAAPQTGAIARGHGARRGIRIWLWILFVMVAVMVVLGGMTRLTDSGLSITEWKPITGAIPPLSESAWMAEFELYRQIPEYQLQNKGMSLSEFKYIYWWEWGHRQLGRAIGLVWALGFFWFLLRRRIPAGWTVRLFSLGALGGLQGAIGWWMVSSGLTGRMVDVASYRLATHLGLAFIILGLIGWYLMKLGLPAQEALQARRRRDKRLARLAGAVAALAFFQIILGALVAGIDAGRGYIDWPLMNGQFLPSESFDYEPRWTNYFENPALVQFNHRIVGYLLVLLGLYAWWRSRRSALRSIQASFNMVLAILALQLVLGIATVVYAAPVHIAILHQIGAMAVMMALLRARFVAQFPPQQSLR